ncbi:hypothetical protein H5410_000812 [Solanum commersonii]|uniref:Uncharacterized protein n=1 Tax=Solanum commersonii TaxID=4109 RepID=A0A9J6AYB3_SOLCO|nr:hypothetical protein H5410_000812 [Solanum commersonii]
MGRPHQPLQFIRGKKKTVSRFEQNTNTDTWILIRFQFIQTSGGNIDDTSTATSFQHQASITLARVISSNTVDKVWGETYNKARR